MSTDGITRLHFGVVDQSLCDVTGCSLATLKSALSLWLCESPDPMCESPECDYARVSPEIKILRLNFHLKNNLCTRTLNVQPL